jgi:hypothetical protein
LRNHKVPSFYFFAGDLGVYEIPKDWKTMDNECVEKVKDQVQEELKASMTYLAMVIIMKLKIADKKILQRLQSNIYEKSDYIFNICMKISSCIYNYHLMISRETSFIVPPCYENAIFF